jgi:hypothetical protein
MSRNSTWLPFQSAQVAEIVAQMQPEERVRYSQWVQSYWIRFTTVSFVALELAWWLSGRVGTAFGLLVFGVAEALLVRWVLGSLDQLRRGLLCSSEYARSRGYSTTTLRLWRLPWSG